MKIIKKFEKDRLERIVTPYRNHPEIKGPLADSNI
jgi:hypothetical protein